MNKWYLYFTSIIISLFSTYAARMMIIHYQITTEHKYEHMDNLAALAIVEVFLTLFVLVSHFVLHVAIFVFMFYENQNRSISLNIFFRFTESSLINFLRVTLTLLIVAALMVLISYSFPIWSVMVIILMLVVYSIWMIQIVYEAKIKSPFL